jgi:hypothetical protein
MPDPTDPRSKIAIYQPSAYERSPTAFRDSRSMTNSSPGMGDALPIRGWQAPLVDRLDDNPRFDSPNVHKESRFRDV